MKFLVLSYWYVYTDILLDVEFSQMKSFGNDGADKSGDFLSNEESVFDFNQVELVDDLDELQISNEYLSGSTMEFDSISES